MAKETNKNQAENADGKDKRAEELKNADQLYKEMEALSMKYNLGLHKNRQEKTKEFKFWKTQPVPQLDEKVETLEPIEADKKPEEIKRDSLFLPAGYKWDTLDIDNPQIVITISL